MHEADKATQLSRARRQTPLQGRVLSDPERRANDWVAAWEEDGRRDGDGGVIFETHKRAAGAPCRWVRSRYTRLYLDFI